MSISQSRFEAIFSGQSSVAKKVYDAVPISESWNVKRITAELIRQGTGQDPRTIAGCLDTLKRSGLINELLRGEFRRESVKEVTVKKVEVEVNSKPVGVPTPEAPAPVLQPGVSPMDVLGHLAARAAALSQMARNLCADIENAAVEIQQHVESVEQDTQKFKQLQSLLKSMS
ncbi:hypothetical protein [Duganella violaceipulchra]|uniref:Uncharacterized protein n=1 Tax=Duganella violaceipulchra TaxID=2849652 RepID=A0AA41H5E1_9BURK|nr:hypothetical protein [Duganella violaceicalia]MBV6321922.1 hypothetical protein [Duganella violaceicalia]MCP2007084.1 hypothetical protein [Duganella violaceicalia]